MPDRLPPCPLCGKPAGGPRLRPFCSPRCADLDLGRWFTGAYAIPAAAPDEDPLDDPDAEDPPSPLDRRPRLV